MDVLLSDAPLWVLQRYDTIIVAGEWQPGKQDLLRVRTNLAGAIAGGARVVATAGAVGAIGAIVAGVSAPEMASVGSTGCAVLPAGTKVDVHEGSLSGNTGGGSVTVSEAHAFTACTLQLPAGNTTVLASAGSVTLAAEVAAGSNGGSLVVLASPYGVPMQRVLVPSSAVDVTLPSPFPLLSHAAAVLAATLNATVLFDAQPPPVQQAVVASTLSMATGAVTSNTPVTGLSTIVTRVSQGVYFLLVANPALRQQPLAISSRSGTIAALQEVQLLNPVRHAVGYLPDGFSGAQLGSNSATTIAGADVRLFKITLTSASASASRGTVLGLEQGLGLRRKLTERLSVTPLPPSSPPPLPRGSGLRLRPTVPPSDGSGGGGMRASIEQARPFFFQAWDTVLVDYRYYSGGARDEALQHEQAWLKAQVCVCVWGVVACARLVVTVDGGGGGDVA